MSTRVRELLRFLAMLDELDLLRHVLLVGSWVELVYERCDLLQDFKASIYTMDIDFLVRSLRVPTPEAKLAVEAKERGYLVESDRLTGVTKILTPIGLEVEFLIAKVGAGYEDALKTNLGVTAQSLRHLEMLTSSMITMDFEGMRINIPGPEAYVVQKMVVNAERRQKREKDTQAILKIWPLLDTEELEHAFQYLTKKERARANAFMLEHGLTMDSQADGLTKSTGYGVRVPFVAA